MHRGLDYWGDNGKVTYSIYCMSMCCTNTREYAKERTTGKCGRLGEECMFKVYVVYSSEGKS